MTRVVVIGDLVTDVVVRLAGPVEADSDTPARTSVGPGGAGGNVAAWLATTGADVTLVARVGDDVHGRMHVEALQTAGVTVAAAVDRDLATGTVVVLVDRTGQRTMLTDRAANTHLGHADVTAALIPPVGHLHLSGYPLLDPASRPAALTALDTARSGGWTVSVAPSSAAPLAAVGSAAFLEWTAGAAWCLLNLAEAGVLAGPGAAADVGRVLTRHYGEVVVTCGAGGAVWCSSEETVVLPATPAEVVDTTGAGDALAAGFLAARLANAPGKAALQAGLDMAATAVKVPGGRPHAEP